MANENIAERVELLETRVTRLEELPGRMDRLEGQILELRSEMREEFSTVRGEMAGMERRLSSEMHLLHDKAMTQTRALFEDAIERIALTKEGQPTNPRSPQTRKKQR